ncbi:MAG: Rossmann-like and DUF2520 domain-containing protein [Thermodesulfobacteriota bacterium]|nr:Rossmann-like and DUF2520 domain-containing protein [Thermodesulfobacteriota bacterium]
MKPSFAVVGGGRVGTALGVNLARAGYPCIGVACTTPASARKAADIIGEGVASILPWEITPAADIVFITTPDSAIARVCEQIDAHKGFAPEAVVLHCSGALPSTILTVTSGKKAAAGSLHPLQSIAGNDPGRNPFAGIVMAVEGAPRAVDVATAIGADLGATCFTIHTDAKMLYHAGAVVASNYLVTLCDAVFSLLEAAGINRDHAFDIMGPLLYGTLENIKTVGIPQALTGPVARGDTPIIKAHIQEIKIRKPDLLPVYRVMGLHTINVAMAKGTITEARAKTLRKVFDANGRSGD